MNQSETWLTVSADPAQVAAAREAASAEVAERLATIFAALDRPLFVDSELLDLLQQTRATSLPRLHELLSDDEISDSSANAAALLCRLQDPRGRDYAKRILRAGSPAQREMLFNQLPAAAYRDEDKAEVVGFLCGDAELNELLLDQLETSDPQVAKAAVQFCGILNFPGASLRFEKLLAVPGAADKGRLLFWLSRGELTESLFDAAIAAQSEVDPDTPWESAIFEAFAKSTDEKLRNRAKTQLLQRLEQKPDDGGLGFSGDRLDLLSAFSVAADESDLPTIRQLIEQERGLYASYPLAALIRLAPQEGRQVILRWFAQPERRLAAIDAITAAYADTADEEIAATLAAQTAQADERELDYLCRALSSIGGPTAKQAIEANADRLDPASLAHFRQSQSDDSPQKLAADAVAAGLFTEEEAKRALQEIQADEGTRSPGLFDMYAALRAATGFDVETGMLPCRHDSLVLDFAKASRGEFRPEAVLEIWHQTDEEDFDAPYTLQFVVNDRLYKAELRNYGDWYDVERTVQAINAALAETGTPNRFVALAADGQCALFVFADPIRLTPVAEKFLMPLSEDVESAMRQGIEYEEHVLRQLDEQQN